MTAVPVPAGGLPAAAADGRSLTGVPRLSEVVVTLAGPLLADGTLMPSVRPRRARGPADRKDLFTAPDP